MKIGFSNGCFNKLFSKQIDRFSDYFLDLYKHKHCNSIELHCQNMELIDYLIINDLDLSFFNFITFHMPCIELKDSLFLKNYFSKLILLKNKYNIYNFVVHSDLINDFDILKKYAQIPISIENTDYNSNFGRNLEDIRGILSKTNLNLTLDLQHCFTNDKSLKLAIDFQTEFQDRIVEYHLSGFHTQFNHYPLFKTKQTKIIDSLKFKENTPIIIESELNKIGDEKLELSYILKYLKKNN